LPVSVIEVQWYEVTRVVRNTDEQVREEQTMISSPSRLAAIFVDRACTEHWIVRDPEGQFWIVPPVENAWECRQPFHPSEETELEPIPGHYRSMLGLPF
jgi:hypothetical protein